MIAYKCDRCGAYYDTDTYTSDYIIYKYGNAVDMCPNCKRELDDFMNGGEDNAIEVVE